MRKSGILLHISSLPSSFGIGDLGSRAYAFADFLQSAGQKIWQILPLSETFNSGINCPYHSQSVFSGNPYFISPEKEDLEPRPSFSDNQVDYPAVYAFKQKLFEKAYQRFKAHKSPEDFHSFCFQNAEWLPDFALFKAFKKTFKNLPWNSWPADIRDRNSESLKQAKSKLSDLIAKEKFLQYLFFKQWFTLKSFCNEKGIQIFGDMPIYVEHDSVDVWKDPQYFKLDENKSPAKVSGVPPDYFSETGQRWGHPVYNWENLKKDGFRWWKARLEHNLKLFDLVRIDHFRGLVSFWEVAAQEKTAINGTWVKVPTDEFLSLIFNSLGSSALIAEDLGIITPDVVEVMQRFNLPGMKVLVFAFGEDNPNHPYLPHNFIPDCVVYTSTHDTNTVRGWFENEAQSEDKARLFKYLGHETSPDRVAWDFITLALNSPANTAIIPFQDVLSLGQEARMNQPATAFGNWKWRVRPDQLDPRIAEKLMEMTSVSKRI